MLLLFHILLFYDPIEVCITATLEFCLKGVLMTGDMLPPLKSLILKWGLLAQWLYWAKYLQAILACHAILLPGHGHVFLLSDCTENDNSQMFCQEVSSVLLSDRSGNDMLCSILFLSLGFNVLTDHFYCSACYWHFYKHIVSGSIRQKNRRYFLAKHLAVVVFCIIRCSMIRSGSMKRRRKC